MYIGLYEKYHLFLSDLTENLNFRYRFSTTTQISNFMKIRVVGAELFHVGWRTDGQADGQRDMMKLIVTFRNFTKAPKKQHLKNTFMLRFSWHYLVRPKYCLMFVGPCIIVITEE